MPWIDQTNALKFERLEILELVLLAFHSLSKQWTAV